MENENLTKNTPMPFHTPNDSHKLYPFSFSCNVVKLHRTQYPLPAHRTVLHFPRTHQARNHMTTVIERRFSRLIPADSAHAFCFLRISPVRYALAEFLVVFPATNVRVASRCFDECSRAVLLVVDPFAIVRVTVLKSVEAVTVALAEAEGSGVCGAGVVG
jgi:hypothetical protein